MKYLFTDVLPGLAFIGLGFYFGIQENVIFAMAGFIACFVIGVTLMIEGWRRNNKKVEEESDD